MKKDGEGNANDVVTNVDVVIDVKSRRVRSRQVCPPRSLIFTRPLGHEHNTEEGVADKLENRATTNKDIVGIETATNTRVTNTNMHK